MRWPILPDYGCFLRWPGKDMSFIHPEDVDLVTRVIPGGRVFRRVEFDDVYYHYVYGEIRFRLKPCMWLAVAHEGVDVGDPVETVGVGMEQDLFVAKVVGMYYVPRKGRILYRLRRGDQNVPKLYLATQLRLLVDKQKIRAGDVVHPPPKWGGEGDLI